MNNAFGQIYIEVSPICNGRCPYCVTGRAEKSKSNTQFIVPSTFEAILAKLCSAGYTDSDTVIHLYVWGEPFLHPEFATLLEIASRFKIRIALSTNASIVPAISKSFVDTVVSVRFSCSGFTQASYDRIHKFNAIKIRDNISGIVSSARNMGSTAAFDVNFHIYQFNLDEYTLMEGFTKDLGISLSANYAILNDWSLTKKWIQKELSIDEATTIGSELFNFIPTTLLKEAPDTYECPQENVLVLSTHGDICICCQTPHREDFYVGNILDDNARECIEKRIFAPACSECNHIKMAYVFNNSLVAPNWVKNNSQDSVLLTKLKKLKRKLMN